MLEYIGRFGHFEAQDGHFFGMYWTMWTFKSSRKSFFWTVLVDLDILELRIVIFLECIGRFGHFEAQDCHFFGMYWGILTFWDSRGSFFWIVLEILDIWTIILASEKRSKREIFCKSDVFGQPSTADT